MARDFWQKIRTIIDLRPQTTFSVVLPSPLESARVVAITWQRSSGESRHPPTYHRPAGVVQTGLICSIRLVRPSTLRSLLFTVHSLQPWRIQSCRHWPCASRGSAKGHLGETFHRRAAKAECYSDVRGHLRPRFRVGICRSSVRSATTRVDLASSCRRDRTSRTSDSPSRLERPSILLHSIISLSSEA